MSEYIPVTFIGGSQDLVRRVLPLHECTGGSYHVQKCAPMSKQMLCRREVERTPYPTTAEVEVYIFHRVSPSVWIAILSDDLR